MNDRMDDIDVAEEWLANHPDSVAMIGRIFADPRALELWRVAAARVVAQDPEQYDDDTLATAWAIDPRNTEINKELEKRENGNE